MKPRRKHSSAGSLQNKRNFGWIFVLPFVFGLVTLYIPVIRDSILIAFQDLTMGKPDAAGFVGANNFYNALFVDGKFVKTMVSSLGSIGLETPLILVYSLFIAVLLNQNLKGRGAFRVIFFIPVILATGVIEKFEMSNVMLNNLSGGGVDVGMGGSSALTALSLDGYIQSLNLSPAISDFILNSAGNVYDIIKKSGVQILVFLSGIQSINPSLYEAAQIEGAGAWESFWKLTVPMISPMIIANAVYTLIDSFTRPSNTMMMLLDEVGFTRSQYGLSQAMALIYTAVIIVALVALVGIGFLFMRLYQGSKRRHTW